MGDSVYFSADDGLHGRELWKLDLQTALVTMVQDINPGIESSTPRYLNEINNILYFAADDGVHGNEIWKLDLATEAIGMLKDINPGVQSSDPSFLTGANGMIYFSATDGIHGRELWVTDGISDAAMTGDFNQNGDFFPYLTEYIVDTTW